MKVSVLIPTLNRLTMLRESLASARGQTHRDLEILVSDDGSNDGTLEFVRQVEAIDSRVHLLSRNPQPGLFENINHLIRHCTGDAFCILADDDRLLPEFVQKLIYPLLDDQIIASFCDHWVIDSAGHRLKEATDNNSLIYGRSDLQPGIVEDALTQAMKGSMCMGFSLYRANTFRQQSFDLSCGGAADFDYAIRAAQLGKLTYVNERLGEYRDHETTATATRPAYMINGIIRVFSKHSFSDPRHERMRREILRSKYRIKALYSCAIDREECLRSLHAYLRLGGHPLHPKILLAISLVTLPRRAARMVKSALRTKLLRSKNRVVHAALST